MQDYSRWMLPDRPCTTDCTVNFYVSYKSYYERLGSLFAQTSEGDQIFIVSWDFDLTLNLGADSVEKLLSDAVKRKVRVRVLQTKPQPFRDSAYLTGLENAVKGLGAEVALDEQTEAGGSHHQKVVYVSVDGKSYLFCGGMDVTTNRVGLWHDAQAEIAGTGAELGRTTLEE